jgi:4-cresol dehydrogenase (hydroxylating)
VPGEDQRALGCYNELIEQLLALRYPPYRLNVGSMAYVDNSPTYAGLLGDLKAALDPNGILAPGRYENNRSPGYASQAQAQARTLTAAGR